MKNIIPLVFVFLFSVNICKAQTLVDTNKVWYVAECLNFAGCGTVVKFVAIQ